MNVDNFLRKITDKQSLIILGPTKLSKHDLSVLKSQNVDTPILIIDGGINHIDHSFKSKHKFILSVGDNDSNLTNQTLDILLDQQKDFSDLSYSLNLVSKAIIHKTLAITMLGFLGGRLDHEIINLGEINSFLKKISFNCDIQLSNKVLSTNNETINFVTKDTFSVISFEDILLSITGDCEYKLKSPISIKALSSKTLSNQGFGEIRLQSNQVFFVIIND